jgi:hypothetical protein
MKFLLSVDWNDDKAEKEAGELIKDWGQIDIV